MDSRNRQYSDPSFSKFLEEAKRFPILTSEQEIKLARDIRSADPLFKLTEENPELSNDETQWAKAAGIPVENLRETLRKRHRAINKFIEHNIRLVLPHTRLYGTDIPVLDLMQQGCFGLKRAAEKFDPDEGCKFSTYAHWWIKSALTRYIHNRGSLVRKPIHMGEELDKMSKFEREYIQEKGHGPSVKEVAAFLGKTEKRVVQMQQSRMKVGTLNIVMTEDGDKELLDLITSSEDDLYSVAESRELKEWVWEAIEELTPAHKDVLTKRYGFRDGQPLSLGAIAKSRNISRERVRQIQKDAQKKVRARLVAKHGWACF